MLLKKRLTLYIYMYESMCINKNKEIKKPKLTVKNFSKKYRFR